MRCWTPSCVAAYLVASTCTLSHAHAHQDQFPLQSTRGFTDLISKYSKTGGRSGMDRYVVDGEDKWTVKTPPKLNLTRSSKKLVPFAFEPLPLGSIKPVGWMKDQMQLMADGMPGHMHRFYYLVKDGTWTGGDKEYSDLNEAWPYWYNGIVALAYGLDDEVLKEEVTRATTYVLKHQFTDGWLGPEDDIHRRNFWGRTPFLLGMMQLIEGQGLERSNTTLDALHSFVELMHTMLKNNSQGYIKDERKGDIFNEQWGRARAADTVIFLQWLYEKDPRNNTEKIKESMIRFYEGSFDWTYWFRDDVFVKTDFDKFTSDPRWDIFPYIHGVNAGQGLKYGAVMRRLTHRDDYVEATRRGTNYTFQYHGTSSGGIVGDEGLSGMLPHRGVELCSVVETMYSLTYNYQALGDKYYADRAELAAYNALPVMITPDWWGHQYIAQINQPISHPIDNPPFWNVGPLGTTFGPEPNYPCCAVNFAQGLPKYVSASFVKDGENGLAHAFLMPAEVKTVLGKHNSVYVRCDTNYPFENTLKYTIQAMADFDFSIRIPGWAESYVVLVNHRSVETSQAGSYRSSGLYTIPLWPGESIVEVKLAAKPRVESRPDDTIAIHYGALLYALPVPARWTSRRSEHRPDNETPEAAKDWIIEPQPDFRWNIAIDPSTIKVHLPPENEQGQPLPNPIWTINAPSTRISAMACKVSNWQLTGKSAGSGNQGGYAPPPPSEGERICESHAFEVWLQPYGALKVHMAEFPRVNLKELGLI